MKEFKVGDKVFDLRHGNGVVKSNNEYSIVAEFKNSLTAYNLLGKWMASDDNPTLFHGHDLIIEVNEPEYEWQALLLDADDKNYWLSDGYFLSVENAKSATSRKFETIELFEPSKRLVERS